MRTKLKFGDRKWHNFKPLPPEITTRNAPDYRLATDSERNAKAKSLTTKDMDNVRQLAAKIGRIRLLTEVPKR